MASGSGGRPGMADIASLGISVGIPGHRIGNVIWEGDWTWVEGVTNIGGYPSSPYFETPGGDYAAHPVIHRLLAGIMPDSPDKKRYGGRCISPLYPIPSTLYMRGVPSLALLKFGKVPPAQYTPNQYRGMGYHYPPIWIINPAHVLAYFDTILRMSYWVGFWEWVREGVTSTIGPRPVSGADVLKMLGRQAQVTINSDKLYSEENEASPPLAYMLDEIENWSDIEASTGSDDALAAVDFYRLFQDANAHYSYRTIIDGMRDSIEKLTSKVQNMGEWKRVVVQGGGDNTEGGKPEYNHLYRFGSHPFVWLNGCGWRHFMIDHAVVPLNLEQARSLVVDGDPSDWHSGRWENTFEYRSLTETLSVLNVAPCNVVYTKGVIVRERDILNTDSLSRWYGAGGRCDIHIVLHVVNHGTSRQSIQITGKVDAVRGPYPKIEGRSVGGGVVYLEEEPGEDTVQPAIGAAITAWKNACTMPNVRRVYPWDRATYIEGSIHCGSEYSYDAEYMGLDGGTEVKNLASVFWTNQQGACNVNPWEGPMKYEYWDAELHPFWPYVAGFGWVYWKNGVAISWVENIDAVDIGEDVWPAKSTMEINEQIMLQPGMNTLVLRVVASSIDKAFPATSKLYGGDKRMTPLGLFQYIPDLSTSRVDDIEFEIAIGDLFHVKGKADGQAGVSDYQEPGKGDPPRIEAEIEGGMGSG